VLVAWAVRIAPSVQVRINLQLSAAVGIDVIAARTWAVGACVVVVVDAICICIRQRGGCGGRRQRQYTQQQAGEQSARRGHSHCKE
jgi:hypothetical protein